MAVPATAAEPTFAELFTPKLVTVLREGYGLRHLKADALAGLTVAIVALPLSMAIAIASGLTPDRGGSTPRSPAASSCPRSAAAGSRSAGRRAPSSCWWPRPWSGTGWTAWSSPPRCRGWWCSPPSGSWCSAT